MDFPSQNGYIELAFEMNYYSIHSCVLGALSILLLPGEATLLVIFLPQISVAVLVDPFNLPS